ncbi:hypothetical protein GALMADRAFT_1087608 [Galerina marginata CBS 339.88]|uniref:60S acidic ribosomal protein P2 n=1 Tax=Galerina marginata (strain CBS 339.88) TaxID=685588 RepID=A0A067TBL1_GALM3|nr:hypothetical protein GALMADRAFT_1087608 [Galerina marginata CBS 339.88]
MRNIAAYLLLQTGGKENPTAADVKKLLGTVGIETDDERLKTLISELSGKSTAELISEGLGKLASVSECAAINITRSDTAAQVPSGGGGGGGGAAAAPSAGGAAAPAAEEKKEEKAEEKEESDDDMGFGLFD